MKKRIATLFLAVVMTASLLIVPAEAASAEFYDVADNHMATAIETLRLMGVLDGYADGSFRPGNNLTRAQFSKMAVFAMDGSKELGQYATTTIFPDVKPSHWASNYVNMAARKGMIAGFTNGTFGPERTVTAAQAVAILLRMLGYKDADLGGVWPTSYMLKANEIGLIDRAGIVSPNAPLTRGQAAIVFMNLLKAKTADGGTLYEMSELVRLTAVDGGRGTMTAGGKVYPMTKAAASTSLIGLNGWVITHNDKALTFLPSFDGSSGATNAAVIIYADGDARGLSALAGNNNYHIYKNGIPADISDLRKGDVAIYSAATNSILVCDTRVTVCYEDCSPSTTAPNMVVALGTEFSVVPTATYMLSNFKTGDLMTLLLTADGQIAGAVEEDDPYEGNAIGIVDGSGKLQLVCGDRLIELESQADFDYSDYYGQAVGVSSGWHGLDLDYVNSDVYGDLDITHRTLGKKNLAPHVKLFMGGELIELTELTTAAVASDEIQYARTNWKDEVDLIVLEGSDYQTDVNCGIVTDVTHVAEMLNEETLETIEPEHWEASVNTNGSISFVKSKSRIRMGDYVAFSMPDENGYSRIHSLEKIPEVSSSGWIGTTAVVCNGQTYTVPANVVCYNANRNKWMSLTEALAYTNSMNLYVQDQFVRMVEIKQ